MRRDVRLILTLSTGGGIPAHPRIWFDNAGNRLAFVQTQMAGNTSRWQTIKNICDTQVSYGSV